MSHAETSGAGTGYATGENYSFAVAGVGLSLRTGPLKLRREPRRRNFETLLQNSDIALRVSSRPLAAESPGHLIFDSGMVWRLYDEEGERVFRFWSLGSGPIPYKELRIGSDYRRGEIILHEPWQGTELPDPLEYPLDELLVVHLLGQGMGVELHSCGIVDEAGRAWLFVGHSGAGKSTLARLWSNRNVTVLSDDRIILREIDGVIRIFGTPWHGEAGFALSTHAPLQGIFVIEHGEGNQFETLSSISAVSELLSRAFLPFHEATALETAMNVLARVAETLPCRRFHFTPDDSAIDTLLDQMKAVADA